jgi:hypothetical protein
MPGRISNFRDAINKAEEPGAVSNHTQFGM